MSSAASWSYTAKLTIWPKIGNTSGWDGGPQFGVPVLVMGDYKFSAKSMQGPDGTTFVSTYMVYTEFATAKRGDRVAIGDKTAQMEPSSDSAEIKMVSRFGDTLERKADDFVLVT